MTQTQFVVDTYSGRQYAADMETAEKMLDAMDAGEKRRISNLVRRLKRRHADCKAQKSYHGAGRYSLRFVRANGTVAADYDLT